MAPTVLEACGGADTMAAACVACGQHTYNRHRDTQHTETFSLRTHLDTAAAVLEGLLHSNRAVQQAGQLRFAATAAHGDGCVGDGRTSG